MSSFTSTSKSRGTSESRSSSGPNKRRYNVFLSFCPTEMGYFVRSLHSALSSEAGIAVFGKDERFQHGEHVESVLNVIEECQIAIVVFSLNYANSSSRIQEFEKITDCARTSDLIVLPVFYDGVQTSFGIIQGSMIGDAFHDFIDRVSMKEISKNEDKLMTWVAFITKATKYFGSTGLLHKPMHRYEYVNVEDILERVKCVIDNRYLFATSYSPSVKSSVQDVVKLLKQSKSPLLLGIWGMTGIGKSTIAQAIFFQIGLYFEYKCFLENVGEVWKINNGRVSLQEKLLSDIDGPTEKPIHTGKSRVVLKKSLQRKRILLVLDNVDKLEQLRALCGSRKWFGEGSKIIITTIDKHLLKKHGVIPIYPVKQLDESKSLEVLNWRAFSQARNPREDFVEVSRQLVACCGGLPLALEAIGRLLCGKEILEWKGVLRSLQRFSIPAPRLLEALENSLSNLSDDEKYIFLDIAHFFIGMNQNDVLQILNRSTQSAESPSR